MTLDAEVEGGEAAEASANEASRTGALLAGAEEGGKSAERRKVDDRGSVARRRVAQVRGS